jgi:hypothetical protein
MDKARSRGGQTEAQEGEGSADGVPMVLGGNFRA